MDQGRRERAPAAVGEGDRVVARGGQGALHGAEHAGFRRGMKSQIGIPPRRAADSVAGDGADG